MNPLDFPKSCPYLFWTVGAILSGYQGWRGILIQRHHVDNENIGLQAQAPALQPWSLGEQVVVHRVHDFIFNFVCSFAGFIAFYLISTLLPESADFIRMETGAGIVIGFLSILALAGISGVLPPLLMLGKLPR